MLVVAIAGWTLFVCAVAWHSFTLRIDAAETNALEVFGLALMLSDDFRAPIKQGYERTISEASSAESTRLLFQLMQGVRETAKRYDPGHAKEPLTIDTFSIALDAIGKIQTANK